MEPLGRFPRVLNGVPRENIEGPPRDFPRAKPEGIPEGDLQYSPEGLHEYSRDLPRGSIHHDSPEGFSQIFIITYVLDQFWCSRPVHAPPPDTAHAPGERLAGRQSAERGNGASAPSSIIQNGASSVTK